MTIATNLAQVLNLFDPREPLSGPKLRDYYVDRPGSPLKQMEVYLREIDRPAKAHIIYTFPIALRHLNDLPQIRNNFGQRFMFPNVKTLERDESPCEAGRRTMGEVVSRRMAPSLITEEALEEVITASGGVMLTLVQLMQSAATYALSQGREAIDEESVHKVIAEVRNDYQALLTQQHYATLRKRRQDKSLVNEEEVRDLLHNLSLLEYRNDQVWCDVNPIVAPLLEGESPA